MCNLFSSCNKSRLFFAGRKTFYGFQDPNSRRKPPYHQDSPCLRLAGQDRQRALSRGQPRAASIGNFPTIQPMSSGTKEPPVYGNGNVFRGCGSTGYGHRRPRYPDPPQIIAVHFADGEVPKGTRQSRFCRGKCGDNAGPVWTRDGQARGSSFDGGRQARKGAGARGRGSCRQTF